MELIDTSAWIEYLRGTGSAADVEVRRLLREAPDTLVTTEPVVLELLAGATLVHRDRDFDVLATALPDLRVRSLL